MQGGFVEGGRVELEQLTCNHLLSGFIVLPITRLHVAANADEGCEKPSLDHPLIPAAAEAIGCFADAHYHQGCHDRNFLEPARRPFEFAS